MTNLGINDFNQRLNTTEANEALVRPFLEDLGLKTYPFGQHAILRDDEIVSLMRNRISKFSTASLLVKYSPDLIALDAKRDTLFFIDIKTSLTPVILDAYVDKLGNALGRQLRREQIGIIEREAWDNYSQRYPKKRTALLVACPYNPRLLLMEWVSNIRLLSRFLRNTNPKSAGSQTPHVNIDLDAMRGMDDFLAEELSCKSKSVEYDRLRAVVKTWPVVCSSERWRNAFLRCVASLRITCPWINYQ